MSERPILFSAPLVRAILDGRKTVTRRVVTVPWRGSQRALPYDPYWIDEDGVLLVMEEDGSYVRADERWAKYGWPGDKLWVRETFALSVADPDNCDLDTENPSDWDPPIYRADGEHQGGGWTDQEGHKVKPPWIPSIHMPRWASRLTLTVQSSRIERLHAITSEDALREGIQPYEGCKSSDEASGWDPVGQYAMFWDTNGKKPMCSWKDNPWVWRIEFRKEEQDETSMSCSRM